MKGRVLAGLILGACCTAWAGSSAHWSYAGDTGPDKWASLSPDYGACGGDNQSPINLTGFTEADLPAVEFSFQVGGNEILNNGHTIQVNVPHGNSILVDGIHFNLNLSYSHVR